MPRKDETIRWTKEKAASEFGLNIRTLTNRLRAAGMESGHGGTYGTLQICRAVFGDIDGEKLRLTKEQADKIELENAATRRDMIPIKPLADTLNRALGAIKAKIQGTIRLDQKERDEICAICERAYRAAFEAAGSHESDSETAAPADSERVGGS